jgi:hypothetical protein
MSFSPYLLKVLALGVLLPGVIAVLVLVISRRATRHWEPLAAMVGATALAAGLWAGLYAYHVALEIGPLRPMKFGSYWLPYLPVLAIPAGWASARRVWPELTFLAVASVSFACAVPVIRDLPSMRITNGFYAFVLGEASLIVTIVVTRAAKHLPAWLLALALSASAGAQGVVMVQSGSARLAMVACLMAGALAGIGMATRWLTPNQSANAVAGAVPGYAVFASGLVFSGYQDSSSNVPGAAYAIVVLAPLALALVLFPPMHRVPPLLRSVVPVAALASLLGFAVVRALMS